MPTHHGKDSVLVRRGKGDIMRVVNVKKSMREKIAEYIRLCRPGAKPNSPLFVSEWGQRLLRCRAGRKGKIEIHFERTARLSYHELYMRIRRIGKRAGIEGLHPHELRHTFASFLYKTQKDIRNTQRQLGHSRPEITARYAMVFEDAMISQAETLYSEPDMP
jgi:integrase/recombinase XerD